MRNKNRRKSWLIYGIGTYIIQLPLLFICINILIISIPISIIIGFFLSFLNDIYIELRKLNGEKFPNLEDTENNDELIKS